MQKTLRSNCDLGCKTAWSDVLLFIKENPCDFFYKDFSVSDIIYACVMLSMMLLKSHDLHLVICGAKHMEFSIKLGSY